MPPSFTCHYDPARISEWFSRHPGRNLAVTTGAPGPDVVDIDKFRAVTTR